MAGPSVFLTPNVGLEFDIGYNSVGGDAYEMLGEKEQLNTFGINVGFQIHLGKAKTGISQKQ